MTKVVTREQVGFARLLAGNLVMIALLAVSLCAMFNSSEPLWLLQAPYFSAGALLALALLPLEMWFLRRLHRGGHGVFPVWFLTASASALLGVPAALVIFVAGALVPTSDPGPHLAGLWGYALIGGFLLSLAAFVCTLGGCVIAEFVVKSRFLAGIVFAGAVVQLAVTVVFIAHRME